MDRPTYIAPTQETGRAFVMRQLQGPIDMLNLLKFREVADYSRSPELAPPAPISGVQAYERYVAHTVPFLQESGAQVRYDGIGGPFLIGPDEVAWDRVLIVRHRDAATFLAFAQNRAYLAGAGHRTAALADSRLLPMQVGG